MERKGSQVYLEVGDVVRLRLPHSEVCIHMRLAGEEMNVRLVQEGGQPMAQLLADDGSRWSFPILPGEAGIFSDGPRLYVLARAVVDMRLRLFVPKPGSATAAMIDPGSAIVGTNTDAPEVLVDYEGPLRRQQPDALLGARAPGRRPPRGPVPHSCPGPGPTRGPDPHRLVRRREAAGNARRRRLLRAARRVDRPHQPR